MTTEQQLSQQLATELNAAKTLLAALQKEHQALLDNDIHAIEAATTEKQHAIIQQQSATATRNKILRDPGATASNGFDTLVNSNGQHSEISTQLEAINQLAHQCQTLNQANGKLIKQRLKVSEDALDILLQTNRDSASYTAQGKPSTIKRSKNVFSKV